MKGSLDLYLVTHQQNLSLEDFFRIICEAVEGGVSIVQLREKEISDAEMMVLGKALLTRLKTLNIPLIINDRIEIAHALQADGVHLGQSDLSVQKARNLLGKKAIIGLSVETMSHLLASTKEDVDYIAASPVFSTNTKKDCAPPWGLSGLKTVCEISPHPVVAIGGIDETNTEKVLECGAKGVAIVSAIFNAPCPKTAALAIKKRIKTTWSH